VSFQARTYTNATPPSDWDTFNRHYFVGASFASNPAVRMFNPPPREYDLGIVNTWLNTGVPWGPGSTRNFWRKDCSAYVPADATGIILHVKTLPRGVFHEVSWFARGQGSTDEWRTYCHDEWGTWCWVPGTVVEICCGRPGWAGDLTPRPDIVQAYICGYTTAGVEWQLNGTPGTGGGAAWNVVDTGRTDACAVFLIMGGASGIDYCGARPYGSGVNLRETTNPGPGFAFDDWMRWMIVGLHDGKFEVYGDKDYLIYGYMLATHGSFLQNPRLIFPNGAGANYLDLDVGSWIEDNAISFFTRVIDQQGAALWDIYDALPIWDTYDPLVYPLHKRSYTVIPAMTTSLLVETLPASDIAEHSAQLNGEVIELANGIVTERGFDQWVGGRWVHICSEAGAFGLGTFSALWGSLTPGVVYTYRAKAKNPYGWAYGLPVSFTSLGGPGFACVTLPATNVTDTRARLNGLVANALGLIVDVGFEYGATIDYGMQSEIKHGYATSDTFYADISGLREGVVYHFRAFFIPSRYHSSTPTAIGGGYSGKVYGADVVFTTSSSLGPVTWMSDVLAQSLEGVA